MKERRRLSYDECTAFLHRCADEDNRRGMARFGIDTSDALGVSMPLIRQFVKGVEKDTALARSLFDSGIHEARIMASILARKDDFTPRDMDSWVGRFNSWDVCDQCCMNLFRYCTFAFDKIPVYAAEERLHTRRAAFALGATLAMGDKTAPDALFLDILSLVECYSVDERPEVKKAVNWALRQIGKRNMRLHRQALAIAENLAASDSKPARWIGRDAIRELRLPKIVARIKP